MELKKSKVVIVICDNHTDKATGVAKELKITQEKKEWNTFS